MKNLFKSMLFAALLCGATVSVSCSDDDTTGKGTLIDYQKSSDTAILLVTFGSTWDDPHATYQKQMEQFQAAYPNADIFFSFTSRTCINRWYAETGEQFVTPDLYLEWFIEQGYEHVYVQSLHVIPGEEFQLLRDHYVKSVYNFAVQDMIPARDPACCGEALLKSEQDQQTVAEILVDAFATQLAAGEAVAFMGHGNPVSDYDHANASYANIEKCMKAYAKQKYDNDNVFVGTVDYPAMLVDYVIDQLDECGFDKTKTVNLHPLMSIAGDHANNDMADESDPESWVSMLKTAGYANVTCTRKGLGDYPQVNAVWIDHLKDAIASLE